MKTVSLSILMLAGAQAHARPDTRMMLCQDVYNLVQQRGAIVLTTGPHTFDRFVSHQGYCDRDQTSRPAYVSTRDVAKCFIGHICRNR